MWLVTGLESRSGGCVLTKTLLLDADSFCYSLGSSNQIAMPWTAELYTYKADFAGAKLQLQEFIDRTLEQLGCDVVMVALSDTKANFRKRILPGYKANRIAKEKPILFKPLRDWLIEEYGAKVLPGLEGDDLVSMWATAQKDTIVCSIDKDCKTIPGWLYNPNRKELEEISAVDAEFYFLGQVLTGDKVDGYSGCPSIGPVRAEKLLTTCEHMESIWSEVVVPAYTKAGLSESVALQNARCARLLRHGDHQDGKVRLWHPKGEWEWLELGTT